ncbi:zinc finger CCCH domain-containing protein 10-like [Mercenaria mercenaria]|uniref:zinc finger CCCH domain-containing protein 10-like n=1 Tax=Mercenaria mercenaria TaxID=6596 RepID=UPI001E1E0695|nr:zinc finger CCCH domain-containing protein 10-like [Mercenaria mercenaria]XP_045168972.1 zinc finger CCCH domain-containing protein 10-like [Mercenaria mercenaria]XP_045168973.1 zinc finger CCCH domain-containing protein 10-like [Mercenaria mercenaria]XP_045168974.1 zinc finger CCCH domain-containing protein 10-like [Mercenaria mercenaria]XP_053373048.1 zinc finger CCCH domain-containing protein 10-like [Mercenaria mercenaria]XP_053373049.1 zinc finger CCCH domain-containing protein 10-like
MSESSEKMSDHSESGSDSGNNNDICRDFLRNVCRRGKRCKYRHPGEQETNEFKKISEYTFCHDFQNNGCRRANCKFLHCTREEEEHARQTGELPTRVMQAAALGIGVNHAEMVAKGGVPICKDNLKGDCHRGAGCKYRHISSAEYEFLQRKSEGRNEMYRKEHQLERFEFEQDIKRRRMDPDYPSDGFRTYENRYPPLSPNSKPLSYQLLEDENSMLRKKVEELKKQVADLTATNEVLLEQNARYRVSKTNILQTLNAAGVQAAIQASSLNPLNTSLAQQIALNSDLTTITQQQQQALQQRMVRELAGGQAQCSIAAPPTLNTATLSLNPPSIVPVSLPQTLSGLQPSNNQSLAQNIDMNASLVSYPIVSQAMRMTASSLAH